MNPNINDWEKETLQIFGYTQECQCCFDDYPIHKYDPYYDRDNDEWIEYNGKEFLCNDCRKEE